MSLTNESLKLFLAEADLSALLLSERAAGAPQPKEIVMLTKMISELKVEDVMSVYSGKAGACMCGCKGTHKVNPMHKEVASKDRGYAVSDDECSDRSVKLMLGKVQALTHIAEVGGGGSFVNHVYAEINDRCYCIYLVPELAVAEPVVENLIEQ